MKFIFDFDDVLFNNTRLFKEHMYLCLEKAGVSRSKAEEYYKTVRENQLNGIWLKKLLAHFSLKDDLYEKILGKSKDFINKELLLLIKNLLTRMSRFKRNFRKEKEKQMKKKKNFAFFDSARPLY